MRRFYRAYYPPNDFDASTSTTKQIKSNGRDVVIAKSNLTPKSIICTISNPMLVALDTTELNKRCYHCYTPLEEPLGLDSGRGTDGKFEGLMTCEDCEMVCYCSSVSRPLITLRHGGLFVLTFIQECRTLAEKNYHNHECSIFQRFDGKAPPSNLRAVIRIVLTRQRGWPGVSERHWKSLEECNGHVDQLRQAGGKRWEDLIALTQCVMEYCKSANTKFDSVLNIFCSVGHNSQIPCT